MLILLRTLIGWYCDGHMLGRCARCYPEGYTPGKVHNYIANVLWPTVVLRYTVCLFRGHVDDVAQNVCYRCALGI